MCLIYKRKGSKKDPNSYRGICLLSSAEKILSLVILLRIQQPLEERISEAQAGFRNGKSCRNATFVLYRQIEKHIKNHQPLIMNFIDFTKAFDSLDWENMWKVLNFQGIPDQIVTMIRRLYDNSSISLKLNAEGMLAPSFPQKIGIRQGCSLSPAIFILVLDFAIRAYMAACEELSISDDCEWLGFADDLVIRSHDVRNAEEAFHQLQSSCAFIGLHINAPKTECIAMNVTSPVVTEATAKKNEFK
jgi:hypothetical protein